MRQHSNRFPPTKSGHDFYEVSSLLQKSLRRGDVVLAACAASELLPQYANYVWNRLMVVSAEDCAGLVTAEIVGLYDAWAKRSKESTNARAKANGHRIFVAKALVLLAKCRHSRDADELALLVVDRLPDDVFMEALDEAEDILDAPPEHFEIPEYVYDIHTRRGRKAGGTRARFMVDEHEALANPTSMFTNWREMAESPTYVQPQLAFDLEADG
jgi:replication-associated recombination protein RarA